MRLATIGRLLVAAQFALLAWIVWPVTTPEWSLLWSSLALALALVLVAKSLLEERGLQVQLRSTQRTSGRCAASFHGCSDCGARCC